MGNLYRELGVTDILLIEDDPWTMDALSLFFRIEGCRVRAASTTEEAIEALSGGRFDLIICEYWLPDMDGLSILRLYGNRQPGAVKFLISAYLTHRAVEEAVRSGIHEVIRKPFTVKTLENSLARHLRRARVRDKEAVGTS
ncbi:MAG: response regulator [Gemmatimonadota bacterium]